MKKFAADFRNVFSQCGLSVFERGWLSSNCILFANDEHPLLIDSGYHSHAQQTQAYVQHQLGGRELKRLFNTHLHSDHCGGNFALSSLYRGLFISIPAGDEISVLNWDADALSFSQTGQACERFFHTSCHRSGDVFFANDLAWEVHASPGHDTHGTIFFQPDFRILISADALWENGFGVVFPELDGIRAFDSVADTLNLIEALKPDIVIPGHGTAFSDVSDALTRARRRLNRFIVDPSFHERHALKVLLKFKLLEWGQISWQELHQWCIDTPYIQQRMSAQSHDAHRWLLDLVQELCNSGAAKLDDMLLTNL